MKRWGSVTPEARSATGARQQGGRTMAGAWRIAPQRVGVGTLPTRDARARWATSPDCAAGRSPRAAGSGRAADGPQLADGVREERLTGPAGGEMKPPAPHRAHDPGAQLE